MSATKHDLPTVLEAIKGCNGVKSTIARRLKVSRLTVDNYLKRWMTAAEAFDEEKSVIDDAALSVVIVDIVQNRDVSTAKWWLAKKLPAEFGDKVDVKQDGELTIRVEYTNDWRK